MEIMSSSSFMGAPGPKTESGVLIVQQRRNGLVSSVAHLNSSSGTTTSVLVLPVVCMDPLSLLTRIYVNRVPSCNIYKAWAQCSHYARRRRRALSCSQSHELLLADLSLKFLTGFLASRNGSRTHCCLSESIALYMDRSNIWNCYEGFDIKRRYVCISHFVNTAQYLLAEIVVSGGGLSKTAEGIAYVNDGDIPAQIPSSLNTAIRTIAREDNITIAAPDVGKYVNFYMKRYYSKEGRWNNLQGFEADEEQTEVQRAVEPRSSAVVENVQMDTNTAPIAGEGNNTPSKQTTSTSPQKASSGSCFTPQKLSGYESEDQLLKETDLELLDKYFVVQGRKLLELFFLTRCDCEISETGVRLSNNGSTPIIQYVTKGIKPQIKRWEGQEKISPRRVDKLYTGNALACIAATTTGVRMNVKKIPFPGRLNSKQKFQKLRQWASEMGLVLPSMSTYKERFEEVTPCIEAVYERHQNRIIDEIRAVYQNDPWDIAVDGAYDSRGHSAELCKVLAVDLRTKLCIHTEVLERSETDNISQRMEKEGFRRMLRWFKSREIPIRSVATDRSAVFGKEIKSYNKEYGETIEWKLDRWHLARYLDKNLHAVAKRRVYMVIKDWIRAIKKHLYYAVEQGALAGDGNYAKYLFNTCLNHVADKHEWDEADITGPIRRCSHDALEVDEEDRKPTIPLGSPAHEKLREILLNRVFQKDIALASSLSGTSQCETKNALDRLYCPKDLFLPPQTYYLYVSMSTMHLNALTEAELKGERVVERRDRIRRKFNEYDTELRHKTPVEHLWRKEIFISFVTRRSRMGRDPEETEPADETPE
ncbi:unnamed protein product [Cylicocyclus nassatus]|uniref:Transposase n=1 Tax=Cylicocyclus nassatus TaxID=53992 RepID=A0AA36GEP4_CYLNA|nr:unnamed protein product [Cylicocyclus nassatus]